VAAISPVNLSMVSVDFETLLAELTGHLQTSQTWNDLLLSSTGTTLLEYASAIGTFNQFNIELAFREAFLSKALRSSSIYGITRMLGVNIARKIPAIIAIAITNNNELPVSMPPYSAFIGIESFTMTQINISAGHSGVMYLKVGKHSTATFPVSSVPYFEYILGVPGFVVSSDADDLNVWVRDNLSGSMKQWTPANDSLWMHTSTDTVFFTATLDDGDVSVIFGDGEFGARPSLNSTIVINYVSTDGTIGNAYTLGTTVAYSKDTSVNGVVTAYQQYGVDEKPPIYYKLYASLIYRARNRAITKTDYVSIILGQTNIAGATVVPQRDIFPNDPKWMNTVRICILTFGDTNDFGGNNPNPISGAWTNFLSWFHPKCNACIRIQTWNPTPIIVNVSLRIAMNQSGVSAVVEAQIQANLTALFSKDMHTLGKAIYQSDIITAGLVVGVDYVEVLAPKADVILADSYTFAVKGSVAISLFYSERTSLPTYKK
jgi:hypothetical protein